MTVMAHNGGQVFLAKQQDGKSTYKCTSGDYQDAITATNYEQTVQPEFDKAIAKLTTVTYENNFA